MNVIEYTALTELQTHVYSPMRWCLTAFSLLQWLVMFTSLLAAATNCGQVNALSYTRVLQQDSLTQSCQTLQGILTLQLTSRDGEKAIVITSIQVTYPPEFDGENKDLTLLNDSDLDGLTTGDLVLATICGQDLSQSALVAASLQRAPTRLIHTVDNGLTSFPTTGAATIVAVPVRMCGQQTMDKTTLQNLLLDSTQTASGMSYADYVSTCSHSLLKVAADKTEVTDPVDICPSGWTSGDCDLSTIGR